jgi:hypothetical protein
MSLQLPFKQRKFVANYILLGGNGVKAVYAAGYQQGYFAAGVTAHRLLKKAKVMAEIESHVRKAKLNADDVINELSDIAQVKTDIDGNQRLKALELLGKFHKLFVDRVESTDTSARDGIESAVLASINAASQRDNMSKSQTAIALFTSLPDVPGFNDPANYGEFAEEIRQFVAAQQVSGQPIVEGGEQ